MYLLLQGCDEGACIKVMLDADMIDLLQDPSSYGVKSFEDYFWFMRNQDPGYWVDGQAVLIKFDGVTIPKEVVSRHWVIE